MMCPLIKNTTLATRIFTFVFLVVFGAVFGMLLSMAVSLVAGDVLTEVGNLRSAQMCSQLLGMVMPPVLFAVLMKENPFDFLGFKEIPLWSLLGIVTMLTILPFNNMVSVWNEGFRLPESMSALEESIREMQNLASDVTDKMINVSGVGALLVNILMMGVLAALGEELMFRSVLQPFLIRICRNYHVGIILTAIVFSAIHFEFYGFIPRMILGIMLGYMFYMSGSIWSSVIMHFFNNTLIVVLSYMDYNKIVDIDVDTFGSTDNVLVIVASLVATVTLFVLFHRLSKKSEII